MKSIEINLPTGWKMLEQKQLRLVFELVAMGIEHTELATLCFAAWAGLRVVCRIGDKGELLCKKNGETFKIDHELAYAAVETLRFLEVPPEEPCIINRYKGYKAKEQHLYDTTMEEYLRIDNNFQGYLANQNDVYLANMADILYQPTGWFNKKTLKQSGKELPKWLLVATLYWWTSLKTWLAKRFTHLFPPNAQTAQKPTAALIQKQMDAMIRALTKGDITKENEVLKANAYRAMTELNEMAREAYEMEQINKKK